ncbi:MAG TPA: septal ring lytic transglycosylase RlpA family protein [Woeseiaceae bacterium]|nr:septal ring lytic transglycosylase RlpA family protein [Woeseiaceae bacterium]
MWARCVHIAGLTLLALSMASCSGNKTRDGAPSGSVAIPDLPGNAIPKPEARSRYGNGPVYEVLGKRYTVLPSGSGYRERGVASWYGDKFHGRLTSNREPYDMYQMTAAHKTLPLPTYVRVRNLRNNESIIVRVNDRGPFVSNRIIDLSYAAALKLDMIADGTTLVEVTAITFDGPGGDLPVRQTTAPPYKPAAVDPADATGGANLSYVQVGAFGDRANAERRKQLLKEHGISNAFIHTDTSVTPNLYRVRIGPVREVPQYDLLVEKLATVGIDDPYLVAE